MDLLSMQCIIGNSIKWLHTVKCTLDLVSIWANLFKPTLPPEQVISNDWDKCRCMWNAMEGVINLNEVDSFVDD